MIYKFKSRAAGDLVMTGMVGDQLLGLIGKEPGAQGIIEPRDMAAAIQALEAAVSADEAGLPPASAEPGFDDGDPAAERRLTLRQRVWPLIEMLKRCHDEGEAVVWGV